MKNLVKTPLALTLGSTLLTGLAVAIPAEAGETTSPSLFAMTELSQGYMQLAEADSQPAAENKKKEGSCGEGKCGAKKTAAPQKTLEGKCGGKKTDEGSCGANKAPKTK